MIDAIRYLFAGGITWRAMPAAFPAWDRVYAFFRRWREPTASVPAALRGFDGNKRINGRKRHVIVDTLGLLLTVLVTSVDRDAACGMLDRLRTRYRKITLVRADGGYTGRLVDWVKENSSSPWKSSNAATARPGSWCCPCHPGRTRRPDSSSTPRSSRLTSGTNRSHPALARRPLPTPGIRPRPRPRHLDLARHRAYVHQDLTPPSTASRWTTSPTRTSMPVRAPNSPSTEER
ncbi:MULTISPECIES: IS5/IS1182 family transposase [unclassified Kitasatospora]|uniref:IS5/IS1182 family transposase n=1 Tax=unclassified Kitasatospora TaxID=2633591 RepID=UPI00070A915A|nr:MULTISPECIES: IS5/IS1182 family transposase [unclassified Kitasatospora]KQV12129.1 hypothetical protein ASC99_34745 [Kitasatospora sp. Root107]KRB69290.1 hypothetical protein ASE03_28065 [Kitasatospora sp. Root187]